jgi:hypothetical protein
MGRNRILELALCFSGVPESSNWQMPARITRLFSNQSERAGAANAERCRVLLQSAVVRMYQKLYEALFTAEFIFGRSISCKILHKCCRKMGIGVIYRQSIAEARQSPHGTRAFTSVFAWAGMLNKTHPLKPGTAEFKCPFAVRVGY